LPPKTVDDLLLAESEEDEGAASRIAVFVLHEPISSHDLQLSFLHRQLGPTS
jgi:hypothetical protein